MTEPRATYLDAPFIVTLPWMDYTILSPNKKDTESQYIRRLRRAAAAEARNTAYITALQHKSQGEALPMGVLQSVVSFYPPDNRWRDLDGLHSAIKAYIDGIFDAFQSNDHRIRKTTMEVFDKEKPGRVVVELRRK